MDFSEKWGNDIETATQLALKDLKLSIDEVNVIVLEEPSKGFFGIGSKLAKVRVEKKAPQKEEIVEKSETIEKIEASDIKREVPKNKDVVKKDKPKSEKKSEYKASNKNRESINTELLVKKPDNLVPVTEHVAINFLKETTEKMGLDVEITAEVNDECVFVSIEGKGTGTIIGKRGQTLDAIQYLTSLVVNKGTEDYKRVVVDAENYREKREKTLENLAKRLADKAVRTEKSVKLEPMNPYERMVIHLTLSEDDRVITKSSGEEPYRRVIITQK